MFGRCRLLPTQAQKMKEMWRQRVTSCGESHTHQSFATVDSEASRRLPRCSPDKTENREYGDRMPDRATSRTDCTAPSMDSLRDKSNSFLLDTKIYRRTNYFNPTSPILLL